MVKEVKMALLKALFGLILLIIGFILTFIGVAVAYNMFGLVGAICALFVSAVIIFS